MTREEFLTLAGQLYDALGSSGSGGKPPKFDTRIVRKGGMCQWASECSLKELIYWRDLKRKPSSDPKYANRDAKQAKALDYWVAYRRANPGAVWSGERDRVVVTAKPPSDKPEQYPRDAPAEPAGPTPNYDFDNDAGQGADDFQF